MKSLKCVYWKLMTKIAAKVYGVGTRTHLECDHKHRKAIVEKEMADT